MSAPGSEAAVADHGTAAAGAEAGAEGGGTARSTKPVVLPETFDGIKSWDDWYFHFENVAAVNGWSDEQKLKWLRVRLTGKAQKALLRIPEASRTTYEATRAALSTRRAARHAIARSSKPGGRKRTKPGPILPMTLNLSLTKRIPTCRTRLVNSWR